LVINSQLIIHTSKIHGNLSKICSKLSNLRNLIRTPVHEL
jgi:hypothetical protein